MKDTQKQDKLPPIKFTKRVGHLFEHVRDIDNLKEAIKDAAKHKRKRKEVQRVLQDIDGHARELQKMLDDEAFIPAPYTMRLHVFRVFLLLRRAKRPLSQDSILLQRYRSTCYWRLVF